MKKLLPLLLVSILFYFSAYAQTETIPNKNLAVQDTIVEKSSKKKEHRRVSDFKVYGGNSVVTLEGENIFEDNFQIGQLEVPLSAGINLLSITRRVLEVRFFGGVVPGYITSIKDNPFNLVVDDFNRFQLSGRAGLGVDVLFLFIEFGYQYGFIDVLKDEDSNLSQVDFRLGFRF
jgi:hypothetical protein